jgi:F-type H+-transporting ATPase subunit alpha
VEILKQGQYSPLKVGEQVAIIYLGTKGKLGSIPINKVRDFEKDFLATMNAKHGEVIERLGRGEFSDELTDVVLSVGAEVAKNHEA